ncbi:hypothetical protein TRSC58_02234 [Trypanosoma rangeli SC58]|uniref:Nuclear pore complex protein n=1 Tax=Trypanosoma rangeli SC58 TaxID=429131 RepID=A0A061J3P3_TRYRA|nr:hypothetical protein TRSC58_02234 [Trypanosoma rangeli SC58]
MSSAAAELPPTLVAAVRSGFDAFVQLQRVRFSKCNEDLAKSLAGGFGISGPAATTAAVITVNNNNNNRSMAAFPQTLSEWSDLLLSRLKAIEDVAVVDPTAEVVWELVSVVLAILENGGDDGVNASGPYLAWYRSRFVSVDAIYRLQSTLDEVPPQAELSPEEEEDLFEGLLGPYMISIQRAFLAGLFPAAAALISSLVDYLRARVVDPFNAEEESTLADVIRLFLETPKSNTEHREWMDAANLLVVDCKRILMPSAEASNLILQAAQQLKSLCLDLLLMVSGDAALILETCHLLELDVVDYVAAVCAVCKPHMTLRQLHHLYQNSWESWKGAVEGPWYVGVIERIVASRCMADVACAMDLVGEAVRCNAYLPTSPIENSNISSSPLVNSLEAADEASGVGTTTEVTVDPKLLRRFALLFMAAHVADICAPPFGAPVDQIHVTFIRNRLVEDFVAEFRHHPLLWRTAAMYVVYSPLMNPAILYGIVTERAASAVSDRYTFLTLHTFICSAWEESSDFQVALRRLLHDKYVLSETLNKWIASIDYYRRKAVEVLHENIIEERMACGDTAPAVWLAVECQQSKPLQIRFEHILRSPEALESEEVYRVGQAVNNNFISVDTSSSLRMLQVLRVCAAMSEYRRAIGSLQVLDKQIDSVPDTDTVCWVLRTAERALRCIVPFRAHPVTVLTLVTQTADVALRLPAGQQPSRFVPLLSHALEMVLTYHSADRPKHTAHAAVIREKIMQLL